MSDARLRELATRLVAMTPPSPPPPSTRRMPPPRRPLIAVAAAGAVVVAIGIPAVLLGGGDAPPLDQTTLNTTTLETTGTTTALDLNIVTTLAPAEPGTRIGLPYFDGPSRGVGHVMYRIGDPTGKPLYGMYSDPAGGFDGESTWRELPASGEFEVPAVEITASGIDTVPIPEVAEPGSYAICEFDHRRCFAIDIVDDAADMLALLPPATPGDIVELPVEGAASIEWTISRATTPDVIEAVLVSAHDGNPPTVASYTDTWVPSGVTVESTQLVTAPSDITGPVLVCRPDGSACFWFEIAEVEPSGPDSTAIPSTTPATATGDLDSRRAQWDTTRPRNYFITGEVTCEGECAAGPSAQPIESFVLGSGVGGDAPSVDELFDMLESVGAEQREISFDPALGYPARATWSANGSTTTVEVRVDPMNPSLDGVWRLESGVVDGEQIPDGDPIELRVGTGLMRFPVDCNDAGGPFSLDGGSFVMGELRQTLVGCGEDTVRAAMFTDALGRATRAERSAGSLVLSGSSTELRLTLVDDGRTPYWGPLMSVWLGEDYVGTGSPGDYRIGSATFEIDEDFGAGDETFMLRNTTAPQVCADFPIDGDIVSDAGCFVVGATNAVLFPSELRIFADGPLPDGSGDAVWTLATAFRVTDSGDLDADGAVVLTVSPDLELDCAGVATLDDLEDVESGAVVEIDPDTAQVVAIRCG